MAQFKGNPRAAKKAQSEAQASQEVAAEQKVDEAAQAVEQAVEAPVETLNNSAETKVEEVIQPATKVEDAPKEESVSLPDFVLEAKKEAAENLAAIEAEEAKEKAEEKPQTLAQKRASAHDGVASGNPRARKQTATEQTIFDVPVEGDVEAEAENIKAVASDVAAEKEDVSGKDVKKTYKQKQAEKKKAREERRAELGTKKLSRLQIALIITGIVVAAVVAGVVALLTTDVVEIEKVEYVGADHLTQAECEALTTLNGVSSPVGKNLLTYDGAGIETNFKSDAWVDSVSFNRVFPHTLQIVVKEKEIAAFVDFASGTSQISQSWVLSTEGTWIMGVPEKDSETGQQISQKIYEDSDSKLHIKDCPNGIDPVIGGTCTDETVINALAIINGFTTDLKNQVKTITASSVTATTLVLQNNVEIAFGEATDIRDKERIAKEIMEQNDKVVYINVRSTERPTWRSAG